MVITGSLIFLHVTALIENHDGLSLKNAHKRWRIALFFAVCFAFFTLLLDGITDWYDWTGKESSCQVIPIFIVLGYILEKQFIYLFLYDRAKIVHESLKLKHKLLIFLRWCLFLTITIGVPIFFYWAAWVAFSGEVTPFGNCIFYSVFPQVIVAFVVSDFFLA